MDLYILAVIVSYNTSAAEHNLDRCRLAFLLVCWGAELWLDELFFIPGRRMAQDQVLVQMCHKTLNHGWRKLIFYLICQPLQHNTIDLSTIRHRVRHQVDRQSSVPLKILCTRSALISENQLPNYKVMFCSSTIKRFTAYILNNNILISERNHFIQGHNYLLLVILTSFSPFEGWIWMVWQVQVTR